VSEIHFRANGNPVELVFGARTAAHISARVRPVGELTFRDSGFIEQEHMDESPFFRSHYTLLDADWQIHPDEAAVEFELRQGDVVFERLSFGALADSAVPEDEQDKAWGRVYAFAKENSIRLQHLHQDCCSKLLDLELERRAQIPRAGLSSPVQHGHIPGLALG
jgi:hypothetical protein